MLVLPLLSFLWSSSLAYFVWASRVLLVRSVCGILRAKNCFEMSSTRKKKLLDDESEVDITINKKFAEKYENKKRDEELSRRKFCRYTLTFSSPSKVCQGRSRRVTFWRRGRRALWQWRRRRRGRPCCWRCRRIYERSFSNCHQGSHPQTREEEVFWCVNHLLALTCRNFGSIREQWRRGGRGRRGNNRVMIASPFLGKASLL